MKSKLMIEKKTNIAVLLVDINGSVFAYHKKNSFSINAWSQGLKIRLSIFCIDRKVKGDAHKHYMFLNKKSFKSIDEALKSTEYKLNNYPLWRKLWNRIKTWK